MASHRRNPSPSPSISSTRSDASIDLSPEELKVRLFTKSSLRKRLFLGHYQERRYVDNLKVYRDVVVVHKSEAELKYVLDQVHSKLRSFYPPHVWIGITNPDMIGTPAAGNCLWVKLHDIAFGFYWFQIKQVRFHDQEISVRLDVIRPVSDEIAQPHTPPLHLKQTISDNVSVLQSRIKTSIHSLTDSKTSSLPSEKDILSSVPSEPHQTDAEEKPSEHGTSRENLRNRSNVSDESEANPAASEQMKQDTGDSAPTETNTEKLSLGDIVILLQWLVVHWRFVLQGLAVGFVWTATSLAMCVRYVGDYSLRFMHEVSFFLRTVTPLILAVIELVGKAIGGLYLLIAMLFNRGMSPMPMPTNRPQRPQIMHGNFPRKRYL